MRVIACVLLVLAATCNCFADMVYLKNPISLAVVGVDMYALEKVFPTPGAWSESRVLSYNDQVKLFVRRYPLSPRGSTILEVDGELMVAQVKPSGGSELDTFRSIGTILYYNGLFHFEEPNSQPVENPKDYYIVCYQSPKGQRNEAPVIEYISSHKFESQLIESIRRIRLEKMLTGGEVIKTYFLINQNVKVQATYYKETIFLKANFFFVHSTTKTNLIDESIRYEVLAYDVSKMHSPELSSLGVYGVRVSSKIKDHFTADVAKINREFLLRDAQHCKPTTRMSNSGVFGMIKYDKGTMFTLEYKYVNEKRVLRVAGRFVTQDDNVLCCICLAMPEDSPGSGNLLSKETVIFSCAPDSSKSVQILLREDTDYIVMKGGYSVVRNTRNPYRIEPYVEYIYYEQFLQTMRKLSDVMRIRCATGFHRRTYRLYVNVFLVYDCDTGIAWFNQLDLWFRSDQEEFWENLSGVTYDSVTESFLFKNKPFTFFRLRQPQAVLPEKVPFELQHTFPVFHGGVKVAVDLKSVEWDLYNIRKHALKNILDKAFGLVSVDNDVLFHAGKSQQVVDGVTKWVVTVRGFFDMCVPNHCVGEYVIIHDGSETTSRPIARSESNDQPSTIDVSSLFHHLLSIGNQEWYVSLSTFQDAMTELSEQLKNRCYRLLGKPEYDDKLTVFIHYFRSKDPIIGYYDCKLQYIFFFSDFKAIKYPSVPGAPPSYRLGEEMTIIPDSLFTFVDDKDIIDRIETSDDPEENELRKKYSSYIVRDLMYDQREKSFQSRSMFLNEVFALRLLPNKRKADNSAKGGWKLKLKGGFQVVVFGQSAPKSAWM